MLLLPLNHFSCDPIDSSPQAPPSLGFSRQEHWSGLPFPSPMQRKSESEVAQQCPTHSNPMDCSLPGSSVYGIFQARVLEWVAIAFSILHLLARFFPRKELPQISYPAVCGLYGKDRINARFLSLIFKIMHRLSYKGLGFFNITVNFMNINIFHDFQLFLVSYLFTDAQMIPSLANRGLFLSICDLTYSLQQRLAFWGDTMFQTLLHISLPHLFSTEPGFPHVGNSMWKPQSERQQCSCYQVNYYFQAFSVDRVRNMVFLKLKDMLSSC